MFTSRQQAASYQSKVIKQLDDLPDLKPAFWSEFEIKVLKKYFGRKDPIVIAKLLNRSPVAIHLKAGYLGLTNKKKKNA